MPKVTSNQVFIADLRATARIGAWMNTKLAAIPRPSSERRMIASFLAVSRTEDRLAVEMVPAAEQGDQATLNRLGTKIGKFDAEFNRLARALGARVCAENVEPSG